MIAGWNRIRKLKDKLVLPKPHTRSWKVGRQQHGYNCWSVMSGLRSYIAVKDGPSYGPTEAHLQAAEMWILCRTMMSWKEKISNEEVILQVNISRQLTRTRQLWLAGHVVRKGKLEYLMPTGQIEGKRVWGHHRLGGMSNWHKTTGPYRKDDEGMMLRLLSMPGL